MPQGQAIRQKGAGVKTELLEGDVAILKRQAHPISVIVVLTNTLVADGRKVVVEDALGEGRLGLIDQPVVDGFHQTREVVIKVFRWR